MSDTKLAVYGPDDYLPAVQTMERITNHLKTALKAESAPTNQLLNAARVCAKFNMEPAHDVHLYHAFGNNWTLDIGIRAYQKSADRWEKETGDKLIFGETRLLTEEEMKRELREQYDEGKTVGVMVKCVKLSTVQTFKSIGMEVPFQTYTGFHFGSKGGRTKAGWYSDKKPGATETYEGQARRRAKKKAYMNEVGLHAPPVTARSWRELEHTLQSEVNLLEDDERVNAKPMVKPALVRDDDGDIVFAPEPSVVDAEFSEVPTGADGHEYAAGYNSTDADIAEVDGIESLDDAPEDTAAHVATTPAKASNGDNPFDDDGWGNWSTMDDFKAAGEWAASRGNWKARKHLNNAWLKCKRENDGDNNPAEFMAAWRIVVNDHVSQPAE